jgi:hypothetical protein
MHSTPGENISNIFCTTYMLIEFCHHEMKCSQMQVGRKALPHGRLEGVIGSVKAAMRP